MKLPETWLARIVTLALLGAAVPVYAAPGALQEAKEQLGSGNSEKALALVDPIIAAAMEKDAKDPAALCPGAAIAFLMSFMKDKNIVVEVENDWCEAMLVKGYALNELNRPAAAAQVLKDLVGHAPDNPNYLSEYAHTLAKIGNVDSSLDLYRQAEQVAVKIKDKKTARHWQAIALRGQGYVLIEMKRWDEARKAYQQSLKFEPDNTIARSELQYIVEQSQQP